jgi:Tfp pilus assembly protein PilF
MRRGIELAEKGDTEGATAALEGALARDASLVTAHAALISLYGRTRNWAKGEEHYKAVVASGAELGDAHFDYGVLLGLQEKWDLAAEAYRKAIEVNPGQANARNNLGQILERDRSKRPPPSTGRPWRASRGSGSRASISAGCSSR